MICKLVNVTLYIILVVYNIHYLTTTQLASNEPIPDWPILLTVLGLVKIRNVLKLNLDPNIIQSDNTGALPLSGNVTQ